MRHDKILRALSLPLVTLLGICAVVVAVTPFTRFGTTTNQAAPAATSNTSAVLSEDRILPMPADLSSELGEPERSSTEVPRSADEETLDEVGAAATDPGDIADPEASMDTDTQSTATQEEFDVAMWSTAAYLSDALSTATRYITIWQDSATNPTDSAQPNSSPRTGPDLPQVTIPAAGETGDDSSELPSDSTADDESVAVEASPKQLEIRNMAERGYSVAFLLDGQVVTLGPGETHRIDVLPATVSFDLGGGRGSVTKHLTEGTHDFRITESGWDLLPLAP